MNRPVLRYHGGKFRIADWILSFFPEHACYLEPFGGGASVLMKKERVGTEIYNDLDGDIVNLFRVLREHDTAAELWHRMRFTPFSRAEFDDAYSESTDPVDQAHKLILRSFMGHGSDAATRRSQPGFRTKRSSSGVFTKSPAVEFANYPDAIYGFHERLRGVVIENRPAIELIRQFDHPPYVLSSRTLMRGTSNNNHGYRYEMSDENHRELADLLHSVSAKVVVSGYPSELYKELYPTWQRFERKAHAEAAKERTEVVWLNPACSAALIRQQTQQRLIA